MSVEPREPTTSEQPNGPEAEDQPTRDSPAVGVSSPAGGPREPWSGPAGPTADAPEVWSFSSRRPTSDAGASSAGELDKAPRVETVPSPADPPSGGGFDRAKVASVARDFKEKPEVLLGAALGDGFDRAKVASVARDLKEKPEVLLGAAFGGGILLAIIIRRLGS